MESYNFYKVRNVFATKGNTSSRHFTTLHASYFTENINKGRNESPCLSFSPGSSGSVTRENIAIFSSFRAHKNSRFQAKMEIVAVFYSEGNVDFVKLINVFGVISTLITIQE